MLADVPFNALTRDIIGAASEVHRALGPGLLESSYAPCLRRELTLRGIPYRAEQTVRIEYKGVVLDPAYRVDLIVEDAVVVELKSVDRLISVHDAQVLTYMRLTSCPAGLLINFNVPKLVDGVKRLILPSK
jgi:GxxExxY protein